MRKYFIRKIFWIGLLTQVIYLTKSKAQDIIFKNYGNNAILNYLDTSIIRDSQTIRIDIGAEIKLSQNTVFFNKLFKIRKCNIKSVKIKSAFIQSIWIDSSTFLQNDIIIDSTDFDTLFITNSELKGKLSFRNVNIQHLRIIGNQIEGDLSFNQCNISNLEFHSSKFKNEIRFEKCSLGNQDYSASNVVNGLYLFNSRVFGLLKLDYSKVQNEIRIAKVNADPGFKMSFSNATLPESIAFLDFKGAIDTIDLTTFAFIEKENKKSILSLEGVDITKLKLNYDFFKLKFTKYQSSDQKSSIYESLLENLSTNGYQHSYEKLDVEYKRFKSKQGTFGFLWWVPEIWWNYGYDRGRVFKIAFWLILLLTFLNYWIINFMVSKVYPVGNIPAYFRPWSWSRLWFTFVYTCILFFSLSLKIDKIRFQEKAGTLYLMFIYVLGLVCLAYMANYIIQR